MRNKLTQDYLKECMTYYPEKGIFIWNKRPLTHFKNYSGMVACNAREEGKECGCVGGNGYRQIRISGKIYKEHRLAFLYMEGYFPENDVDHIDRNKINNKWGNLREVSERCNGQNCNLAKDNKSGVTGVLWRGRGNKWEVYLKTSEGNIYLGRFAKFEDAVMRRYQEEVNNPLWTCSVESTAYKYLKERSLI